MRINSAKDLEVYKKAYTLSMEIFELSKTFPKEERYALTSQIRRSSRSVCLNLREAWAKRRYEAHFINKLTDCDGENSETNSSIDFAYDCGYITLEVKKKLNTENESIGRMIGTMLKNPNPFLIQKPS
jgi:four helix bundle protein